MNFPFSRWTKRGPLYENMKNNSPMRGLAGLISHESKCQKSANENNVNGQLCLITIWIQKVQGIGPEWRFPCFHIESSRTMFNFIPYISLDLTTHLWHFKIGLQIIRKWRALCVSPNKAKILDMRHPKMHLRVRRFHQTTTLTFNDMQYHLMCIVFLTKLPIDQNF